MREALRAHAPTFAGFVVMVTVAVVLAGTLQAGVANPASPVPVIPGPPIPLPGPGEDADGDSYADDVDLVDGDRYVRLEVSALDGPVASLPYLVVGTQDDHWRLGAGAELEWPHVVDVDPLGHKPGSPAWQKEVIRTGAWWVSEPMEGAQRAMAPVGRIDPDDVPDGVRWPQSFWVNVRDDRPTVTLRVQLRDAQPDPDRGLGAWDVHVDVVTGTAWVDDGAPRPAGENLTASGEKAGLGLRATAEVGPNTDDARAWAERWSPTLRFDDGERFFPLPGETLMRFHGFGHLDPADRDYQTWTRSFNNGRDPYLLLLADFDGDRTTDHDDAALLYDVLATGDLGRPVVYASVQRATNDRVAVTYWFLYVYNFVRDADGEDIVLLAHAGDREFVSLLFASPEDAASGRPEVISYSQHYGGVRVPDPPAGVAPFDANATHPSVYVARGSHASYPAAGDDRRFRPAFLAFGDEFDGLGEALGPDDYELQLLDGQEWHQGYLWGPITRHSRDLGTAGRPLLQHSFKYPYIDAVSWHLSLTEMEAEELAPAYGGPT